MIQQQQLKRFLVYVDGVRIPDKCPQPGCDCDEVFLIAPSKEIAEEYLFEYLGHQRFEITEEAEVN